MLKEDAVQKSQRKMSELFHSFFVEIFIDLITIIRMSLFSVFKSSFNRQFQLLCYSCFILLEIWRSY